MIEPILTMIRCFTTLEEIKESGIKYVLSIGKRQPMHIGHKKNLERILSIDNVTLVYVIGSANKYGDHLFDPYVNPLNIEQQIEQFKEVFPKETKVIFLPINDVADMSKWGPSIKENLEGLEIYPEDCAIHFIGKPEDKIKSPVSFILENGEYVTLKAGQWLVEAMSYYGFTIWFDEELEVDLSISARNLRKLDLNNLTEEQKKIIAAPDYLIKIAKLARDKNPDKLLMKDIPITLADLTLERMRIQS